VTPRITLIVAVADNGVIGRGNQLPWRLPDDLKRFKALTMGHPIVMGRKTHESIGRALPGRTNLVISRNPEFQPAEGCVVAPSLDAALERLERLKQMDRVDTPEVFIIGGASLYAEALPRASRLQLTEVHADFDGDVFCPDLHQDSFTETSRERHEADDRHPCAFSFVVYVR